MELSIDLPYELQEKIILQLKSRIDLPKLIEKLILLYSKKITNDINTNKHSYRKHEIEVVRKRQDRIPVDRKGFLIKEPEYWLLHLHDLYDQHLKYHRREKDKLQKMKGEILSSKEFDIRKQIWIEKMLLENVKSTHRLYEMERICFYINRKCRLIPFDHMTPYHDFDENYCIDIDYFLIYRRYFEPEEDEEGGCWKWLIYDIISEKEMPYYRVIVKRLLQDEDLETFEMYFTGEDNIGDPIYSDDEDMDTATLSDDEDLESLPEVPPPEIEDNTVSLLFTNFGRVLSESPQIEIVQEFNCNCYSERNELRSDSIYTVSGDNLTITYVIDDLINNQGLTFDCAHRNIVSFVKIAPNRFKIITITDETADTLSEHGMLEFEDIIDRTL